MQQTQDTYQESSLFSSPQRFAVILANEKAGGFSKRTGVRLTEAMDFLRQQGWRIDLHFSKSVEEARQHARDAVRQQAEMVVAVGGDGTINSIIQELVGSGTALGLLPGGTINDWARIAGIPLDMAGACEALVNGQMRSIDLGCVHGHYFLLVSGIGFSGIVSYAVSKEGKKSLGAVLENLLTSIRVAFGFSETVTDIKKERMKQSGVVSYLLTAMRVALGFGGFQVDLTIDGQSKRINALQVLVGNARTRVSGNAWQGKCDDGLLDVCVVRDTNVFERIIMTLDFLLRRDKQRKWISYTTGRLIEVRTHELVHIHIDGEPIICNPATFTVATGVLKVVVPQKAPEDLFSQVPTMRDRAI